MRIAVVGSVVDDHILAPGGTESRSLGGLAYAVTALASLAPRGVTVLPICRVCDDVEDRLQQLWGAATNVDLSALVPTPGRQTRVRLDYRSPSPGVGDRDETLLDPMPPLLPLDVRALQGAAHVLVNCITGFDLTLEAMQWTGRQQCEVLLDVHSLALALGPDGRRHSARPSDAGAWLQSCDVLQCNALEAEVLFGSDAAGTAAGTPRWPETPRPRAVITTMGAQGAMLHQRAQRPEHLQAPAVRVADPTGAGDTFGAAFVAARARRRDIPGSGRAAVQAASASCELSGPAALLGLAAKLVATRPRNRTREVP